jgi:hypothetical protein
MAPRPIYRNTTTGGTGTVTATTHVVTASTPRGSDHHERWTVRYRIDVLREG